MAGHRTWRIVRGDGSVESYSDGKDDDAELLAQLLTRWSRDFPLAEWSDRGLFAGLCYREANISATNAAGMVGLTPDDVEAVEVPDGPPWKLSHPTDGDTITIERREGSPDPKSW